MVNSKKIDPIFSKIIPNGKFDVGIFDMIIYKINSKIIVTWNGCGR